MPSLGGSKTVQPQDGLPVPLQCAGVPAGASVSASQNAKAYAPYQVVIATRHSAPGTPIPWDSPATRPALTQTTDDDFAKPVPTAGGPTSSIRKRPPPIRLTSTRRQASRAPLSSSSARPLRRTQHPAAASKNGTVPNATPLLVSPNLSYTVSYDDLTRPMGHP